MPDDEGAELSLSSFWDDRYTKAVDSAKPTHEWFRDYTSLKPFFSKHLFDTKDPLLRPRVLHLGCGDSTIPYDLLKKGYDNQLCLDFSRVAIELMRTRYASEKCITWEEGDVRDMKEIASKSIDIAFDKGTLDAMIFGSPWSPPDEVLENSGKYMTEVHRILKDDGFLLYITFRQPHFIKPILNQRDWWDLQMETLGGGDSFEYYGYIITKRKKFEAAPGTEKNQ